MVRAPLRFRPAVESLEARDVPAVTVRFDYSLDTSGFFLDPNRRVVLEQAAATIAPRILDDLGAIVPGGGNTWAATFSNPAIGGTTTLPNLVIGANELLVFVNAGPIGGGGDLGIASTGFSVAGDPAWVELVSGRGQPGALASPATDHGPWGGLITFGSTTDWYFGSGTVPGNQFDFFSVATHELLHLFGFATADSFDRFISGSVFVGPNATAAFGGSVPLNGGRDHWADGLQFGGQTDPMVPAIAAGERRTVTALDFAALQDIGWQVANVPSSSSDGGFRTPPAGGTAPGTAPGGAVGRFTLGSGAGTTAAAFSVVASGTTTPLTVPFGGGFTGGVRVATADLTGDGVPDTVFGTGPGAPTQLVVVDGKTGATVRSINPFEATFTGGIYVAAGDLNGDGRADLVVTPDEGGGPRVLVFDGATGGVLADFLGIDDANFRGGARPALGDLDGDNRLDLVVAAGFGGGPRVAIYRGTDLVGTFGRLPARLVNDFFVFEEALRNGAFVAAADLNGDGFGDLIAGGGPGGGPRVSVFGGLQLLANQQVRIIDFFAGSDQNRGGVNVAAIDVEGDGWPDVVTGDGPVTAAGVPGGTARVYASGDLLRNNFQPWLTTTNPALITSGVFVG